MDDALSFLESLPRFSGADDDGYKPGLERMEALMDALGRPHDALHVVHVAGTNGKGSTASMVASIATASGRRTGLHTSPHLRRVHEIMRVDGMPVPNDGLAALVDRARRAIDRVEPSYFEATVALSLLYFAEQAVDLAVVEVGLGGRLDATNVVHPALAVITTIDLEHTALLGDTVAAIAREKAGIVKPGVPVLVGATQADAVGAIRAVAADRAAPLHVLDAETTRAEREATLAGSVVDLTTPVRRYDALHVALPGRHQQRNAALAVRAAEVVLDAGAHDEARNEARDEARNETGDVEDAIRTGLADVRRLSGLRGRLDVLRDEPLVVADVAHNPSSLAATLDAVAPEADARGGRLRVVLGLLRDKDAAGVADVLRARDAIVTPVPLDTPRATPPDALADALRSRGVHVLPPSTVRDALRDAVRGAAADVWLVTGSHYAVAEAVANAG